MTDRRRAAIYARFSSDLQRDRSIEDQVALCESYCRKEGLEIVARYSDRARSGASVFGRDGLMAMMEAAAAGEIDVLVVEALDRLSRDQEDLAGIYKRLSFRGIAIRAVHDGQADEIQVGIRGLVGALYLKDLAHKVRRGMAGVIRDGRAGGGLTYGYRPVPGRPGEREILEHEAAVVRRIFAAYAGGASVRSIASELNGENIPPPLGKLWMPGTIMGSRKRANGIILNPAYGGELVWNRIRMVKDPETGRRLSRDNPQSEWIRQPAPHLRIVDEKTFAAAQLRRRNVSHEKAPHKHRRAKHLLSGLLRCGVCGGGMSVKDRDLGRLRVICTRAREAGACSNRRPYRLDKIEELTVVGLKERMKDKAALAYYVKVYNAERAAIAAGTSSRHAQLAAQLRQADQVLERTIGYAIKGIISEEEAARQLPPLREEKVRLERELALAEKPPQIVQLHPAALEHYRAQIDRLDTALRDRELGEDEAREALRDMVTSVTVHAPSPDNIIRIQVEGHLAALIGGQTFPRCTLRGGLMVAEARYSPIPPGEEPVVFGFSGRLIIRSGLAPEIALEPIRLVNSQPGGKKHEKPRAGSD